MTTSTIVVRAGTKIAKLGRTPTTRKYEYDIIALLAARSQPTRIDEGAYYVFLINGEEWVVDARCTHPLPPPKRKEERP